MPLLRLRRPAKTPAKPAVGAGFKPEPAPTSTLRTGPTFLDLPPELHLMITQYLIYPDALSLKHTSRYFHSLVYTGVRLKVDWLIQRRSLHLECPSQRCDLNSDLKFCRGSVAYVLPYSLLHLPFFPFFPNSFLFRFNVVLTNSQSSPGS